MLKSVFNRSVEFKLKLTITKADTFKQDSILFNKKIKFNIINEP